MAAGLGFKTFTTGEVLTAADVNGYLMQGVGVFTDSANRDAEITSPQEGQFAYLKDTNVTTYYTGSAWANLDTTGMTNPMTTTGDTIYSSSGSTPARLGIGSTGQVLTVAGGIPSWATPAGGATFSGVVLSKTADQTIATSSATAITFNSESIDSNGYHDNVTNNSRITIPSGKAGKYWVSTQLSYAPNTTGYRSINIRKNGTTIGGMYTAPIGGASWNSIITFVQIVDCAVSDYLEIFSVQTSGGNLNITGDNDSTLITNFQAFLIGA
jgi:hypothetical protein